MRKEGLEATRDRSSLSLELEEEERRDGEEEDRLTPEETAKKKKIKTEIVSVEELKAIDSMLCASGGKLKVGVVLAKIISGGQAGADIGGLLAARRLGLNTGGTAAPSFSTTNGRQADLLKSFGLTEVVLRSSWAQAYCTRSMMNVDNSDATVAFRVKQSSGTDKTIGYCVTKAWKVTTLRDTSSADVYEIKSGYRPVLVVYKLTPLARAALHRFLVAHGVKVLNIAGHRPFDERPNWEQEIENFIFMALSHD